MAAPRRCPGLWGGALLVVCVAGCASILEPIFEGDGPGRSAVSIPPGPPDLGEPNLYIGEPPAPLVTPTPTVPSLAPGAAAAIAWAWRAYYDGRPQRAREAFEAAAKAHPQRYDAHLGAGAAALALGDDTAAHAHLTRAVELSPGRPEARLYLGYLSYRQGALRQALATFSDLDPLGADRMHPLARDYAWLRARLHLALGERAAGALWFQTALNLSSDDGPPTPPSLLQERMADGRLPAEDFEPIRPVAGVDDGATLLVLVDGGLWAIRGGEPFRQRLLAPPIGWRWDAFSPGPVGQLAVIGRGLEGGEAVGPELRVVDAKGQVRRFEGWKVAPVAPTFIAEGVVIAVGLDRDGQSRLLRFDAQTGAVRAVGARTFRRATDPRAMPDGRLLLSAQRGAVRRVKLWLPGEGDGAWLTDMPADADPWLNSAATGLGDASPLTPTPPPATPMPIAEPWEASAPQPRGPSQSEAARRASSPSSPLAPARSMWSPEDGARQPPPSTPRPPRLAPAPTPPPWVRPLGLEEGDERHPDRAADGRVIFSRQRLGQRRIWLADANVGRQRVLTAPERDCWQPIFTADEMAVVYSCRAGGSSTLYVQDLATGQEAPVFRDHGSVRAPALITSEAMEPVAAEPTPTVLAPTPSPSPSPPPPTPGQPVFLPGKP